VGISLVSVISPILPHLAVEFASFHPLCDPEDILRQDYTAAHIEKEIFSDAAQLEETMALITHIRTTVTRMNQSNADISKKALHITLSPTDSEIVRKLQPDAVSFDSELVELLGTSCVHLSSSTDVSEVQCKVCPSHLKYCPRCRKHNRAEADELFLRCADAVK
jgi:valyl-tRNA synthetase